MAWKLLLVQAGLKTLIEEMMVHNVCDEAAKVLLEPLLSVSEIRYRLTRFHMLDVVVHCPLALKSSLAGSFGHLVLGAEFIP